MMFLTVFLKCRLIKQLGKDMVGHPYKVTLSLLSYKVVGVLRVYVRDLSIDLEDKKDTSPKKHDQRESCFIGIW